MEVKTWQIILLCLYAMYMAYDGNGPTMGFSKPTFTGFIAGLILGDVKTGLYIGGTLNLMALGIGNFGGASIPDYSTGALMGTALTIISGQSAEVGLALALPISLLMMQIDVLARLSTVFFQHRAEKLVDEGEFKRAANLNLYGFVTYALSKLIPVFIALAFGQGVVQTIVDAIPVQLSAGFKLAGAMLPAVGIAILLKYMPVKANMEYFIVGFILVSYLQMPILGVALVGVAFAIMSYKKMLASKQSVETVSVGGMGDE
ncbi:MAG: PTS sugar transporter subunit IIC [Lactobacillales bacterium]|jgi:PTS system mannose-specific IIC component|nr:PTS sugar transporter subunit IIC [Lactobacillales bacterium]